MIWMVVYVTIASYTRKADALRDLKALQRRFPRSSNKFYVQRGGGKYYLRKV